MNNPDQYTDQERFIVQKREGLFPRLKADRAFLKDHYLKRIDEIKFEIMGLQIDGIKHSDERIKKLNDENLRLHLYLEDTEAIPGSTNAIFHYLSPDDPLNTEKNLSPLPLSILLPKIKERCTQYFNGVINDVEVRDVYYNTHGELALMYVLVSTKTQVSEQSNEMEVMVMYESDLDTYFITQISNEGALDVIGPIS